MTNWKVKLAALATAGLAMALPAMAQEKIGIAALYNVSSGGLASLADVHALLEPRAHKLAGAIAGRALYDSQFTEISAIHLDVSTGEAWASGVTNAPAKAR